VLRDGTIYTIALTEVLYTLGLTGSLISVSYLQDKNITICITEGKSLKRLLFERQSRILDKIKRLEKAYTLRGVNTGSERALVVVADSETRLVHRRLEHLSSESLHYIQEVTTGLQGPVKTLKVLCEPCTLAKTVRVVNRESSKQVIVSLARLYIDF
jgi:hypothetical protein